MSFLVILARQWFRCLLMCSLLALQLQQVISLDVCKGEGPRYGDFKCNHDATHRVCANLKDYSGHKVNWGTDNFWQITNQPDWSSQVGADSANPGGGWCICMWATASLIDKVGCDNVHLSCDSTDVSYVLEHYVDGGVNLAPAKACLIQKCGSSMTAAQMSAAQTSLAASNAQRTSSSSDNPSHDDDDDHIGLSVFFLCVGLLSVGFGLAYVFVSRGVVGGEESLPLPIASSISKFEKDFQRYESQDIVMGGAV